MLIPSKPVSPREITSATHSAAALRRRSLTVHLDIDRVVFLITSLQNMPELDTLPASDCTARFHMLPGLLLLSPERRIVYPLLLAQSALSVQAKILSAANERENLYGLSMFAKLSATPDYTARIPEQLIAHLPYHLVQDLFPQEIAHSEIADYVAELNTPAELVDMTPIRVIFELPVGYRLPEICPGKIVKVSLDLHTHTGGLAPNGVPLFINSRSRPTRIHNAPLSFNPPADDYYQLRGVDADLPVTSSLPQVYEDYTDMLNPNAALLARMGASKARL